AEVSAAAPRAQWNRTEEEAAGAGAGAGGRAAAGAQGFLLHPSAPPQRGPATEASRPLRAPPRGPRPALPALRGPRDLRPPRSPPLRASRRPPCPAGAPLRAHVTAGGARGRGARRGRGDAPALERAVALARRALPGARSVGRRGPRRSLQQAAR
ncbi:Hypothetical predicted protein, partial [Marmota monax]